MKQKNIEQTRVLLALLPELSLFGLPMSRNKIIFQKPVVLRAFFTLSGRPQRHLVETGIEGTNKRKQKWLDEEDDDDKELLVALYPNQLT